MTVALVLVLVGCVAVGVWDLFSRGSRAPLRAALLWEGGLLLGALLQFALPTGFALGMIAGFGAGAAAFVRWARHRMRAVDALAASQAGDDLLLLQLHDHLDGLHSELSPGNRVAGALALVLLAAIGVSMIDPSCILAGPNPLATVGAQR